MSGNIAHVLDILERLVGFDTTSHKTNAPLINWVKNYLDSHGVTCSLLPDVTGKKFNLVACIEGTSPRGIVLSGHTDVVPAFKGDWSCDPFALTRRGDRVYGRGTTDMKGFLSVVLEAIPKMKAAKLGRSITLAFSYDEEIGCFGAPEIAAMIPKGQEVIVGEPTSLVPSMKSKGARAQTLSVNGIPAHSGSPERGVNAIALIEPALAGLVSLGDALSNEEKEYRSNLVVTAITGGGALNVVPAHCALSWLFRPASGLDVESVSAGIDKIVSATIKSVMMANPKANVELKTNCDVPLFSANPLELKGELCRNILENQTTIDLPFATEAGIFHDAGHDVIICGPGDMAQGHIDDEYIEIADLENGQKFIGDIIDTARA